MTRCHTPGGKRHGVGGPVTTKNPPSTKTPIITSATTKTPQNVFKRGKRPRGIGDPAGKGPVLVTVSILCLYAVYSTVYTRNH